MITTWSQHFSTDHTPQNLKEQTAMDWMLFAAANNQLGQINSPVGYLKAVTRQGHSADFTPFQEKKALAAKAQAHAAQQKQKRRNEKQALEREKILAREKYEKLPEPDKTNFINDFRNYLIDTGNKLVVKRFDEGGISPGMIEALFGSFINDKMIPANREQPLERLSKSFFIKLPLKSPPTPRELQC